jgi:hypothetical protein
MHFVSGTGANRARLPDGTGFIFPLSNNFFQNFGVIGRRNAPWTSGLIEYHETTPPPSGAFYRTTQP